MSVNVLGQIPMRRVELTLLIVHAFWRFAFLDVLGQFSGLDDVGFVEGTATHYDCLPLAHHCYQINYKVVCIKQQMWAKLTNRYSNSLLFGSHSIEQRIKVLAGLDLGLPQSLSPIINPPFLVESTAKSILQFVSQHNIPKNIRILHALAHIQYNAFMSYADTLIRFRGETGAYQSQFQADIKAVALEQGQHFMLLKNRLEALGFSYGSIPVIPKLSLAIQQSNHNLLQRIAIISLVHQGRGVKAVQKLLGQLQQEKDILSVQIVKIIRRDEVKHFSIGWKWFMKICELKAVDAELKIKELNNKYKVSMKLPNQQLRDKYQHKTSQF